MRRLKLRGWRSGCGGAECGLRGWSVGDEAGSETIWRPGVFVGLLDCEGRIVGAEMGRVEMRVCPRLKLVPW